MLLRDLLADTELGLVLLNGSDQLSRPVRGLYITDLMDPRRYLEGGELVLSGLAWHGGPEDSQRFVAALADAGVAALAAGTARLGDAPPDLVEACREHRLPLFQVPLDVSFNTLAERVRRPVAGRELVDAAAAGADLPQVLAMAARELDAACWAFSPAGFTAGPGRLPVDDAARYVLDADQLPRTVDDESGSYVLWPIPSTAEPPAARWFLAISGAQHTWSQQRRAAVAELATAVALLRSRIIQAREIAGRSVEAIVRRLLDGTASPPEVAARLETAGLPTGEPLRVAVLTVGDGGAAVPVLREIAAATGVEAVTVPLHDGACALFVDRRRRLHPLDEWLRVISARIEPGLQGRKLAMGLSETSAASGLRGALDEARHARQLAARRPGAVAVVTGAELASHEVLLAAVPDELCRSYRDRLLDALADYDRRHHSDLLGTLRTFLECSGSWTVCARRLHVHVNTLRYRIRRIEQITGRDLSDFAVRVDFYLALEVDRERFSPVGTE